MNSSVVQALPMEQQWALRDALAEASSVDDLAPHLKRLFDESIHPGVVEAEFDPAKHPRGRRGEWIDLLGGMNRNSVHRFDGFEVHRMQDGHWAIRHDTNGTTRHDSASSAVDRIEKIEATPPQVPRSVFSPGAFKAIFDGFEHNGLRAVVTEASQTAVHGKILNEKGKKVGRFTREVDRRDGEPSVYHESLTLLPSFQGRGFGTAFVNHSFDRYRELGVASVRVSAGSTVGGYQWARQGFDFDVPRYEVLSYELRRRDFRVPDSEDREPSGFDEEKFARAFAVYRMYQARFLGEPFAETKKQGQVPDDMWNEFVTKFPKLDLLNAYLGGDETALDGTFDSPSEIAMFGREHRWTERHAERSKGVEMWLGKRFMVGAQWSGLLNLRDPSH